MKNEIADAIHTGFLKALDWVYPPVCAGCQTPGFHLCPNCEAQIHFITGNRCLVCGGAVSRQKLVCRHCRENPPPYTAMRNLAIYEGVIRECVHAIKYENNQSLVILFTKWLTAVVEKEGWEVEMVLAVPLSAQRQRERGYNQAARIAKPLARHLGVRYNPFGLKRIRNTVSQVGLSGDVRRQNVAGAFEALPEMVGGKKILLVDDVMTTGSTLEACSKALRESGADAIYCLTIARFAIHHPGSFSARNQV